MREHVCARCGDYLLLFPTENIELIEPVPSDLRFGYWCFRPRPSRGEPVLDVRCLLGVPAPASPESGVFLRWRSTTDRRALCLLVDAVEEIVNCYEGDLIGVSILPRRLRPMCEEVMRHSSGTLRLRVKPDVQLPVRRPDDRRHFALSLLTAEPAW
jgi:hypothetical protein